MRHNIDSHSDPYERGMGMQQMMRPASAKSGLNQQQQFNYGKANMIQDENFYDSDQNNRLPLHPARPQTGNNAKRNVSAGRAFDQNNMRPPPPQNKQLYVNNFNKKNPNISNNQQYSGSEKSDVSMISEYHKFLPKTITHDKEKLYAEVLRNKNFINELQNENMRLKTKVAQLEKEGVKMERALEEIENTGMIRNNYNHKSDYLVQQLKKQLKEAKSELSFKNDEILKIKKTIKFTKIQEMEIEKKAYSDETIRLKHILEQTLKQKMTVMINEQDFQSLEEKYHMQQNYLNQLKVDNTDMANVIKQLEDQNYQLVSSKENIDQKNHREILSIKRQLKEKDNEIMKMRTELNQKNQENKNEKKSLNTSLTKGRPSSSKKQLDDSKKLKDELQQKEQEIKSLNERMNTAQQDFKSQLNKEKEQNQQLSDELSNIKDNSFAKKSSNSPRYQEQLSESYQERKQQTKEQQSKARQRPQSAKEHSKREHLKKVKSVKRDELIQIGEELNYRFRALALDWTDIEQCLFDDLNSYSPIIYLKMVLMNEPFFVVPEEKAVLLARYLIEKPTQPMIEYDENRENSNADIKKLLMGVVGDYDIMNEEYAEALFNDISQLVTNEKTSLKNAFTLKAEEADTISKKDLIEAIKLCEIPIQKDQIDFIIMGIILDSEGLDKLKFQKIFKIFKQQPLEVIQDGDNRVVIQEEECSDSNYYGDSQYDENYEEKYDQEDEAENKKIKNKGDDIDEDDLIEKYAENKQEKNIEKKNIEKKNIEKMLKDNEKEILGSWQEEDYDNDYEDDQDFEKEEEITKQNQQQFMNNVKTSQNNKQEKSVEEEYPLDEDMEDGTCTTAKLEKIENNDSRRNLKSQQKKQQYNSLDNDPLAKSNKGDDYEDDKYIQDASFSLEDNGRDVEDNNEISDGSIEV